MKNLYKLVKHLNNLLSANKSSLNVEKTELVNLKPPRKVHSTEIKVKLAGKMLYPSNSVTQQTQVDVNRCHSRRKLNIDKTFRRRPGRLLNVLCTLNLRPVSTGKASLCKD